MTTSTYRVLYSDDRTLFFEASHRGNAISQAYDYRPHLKIVEVNRITDWTTPAYCDEPHWASDELDRDPEIDRHDRALLKGF